MSLVNIFDSICTVMDGIASNKHCIGPGDESLFLQI